MPTASAPNRYSDRAPLDPTVIVRAARTVVERDGIDRLTMRHLGKELGVEAMSIYHHVPNKAALLELVVADILSSLDVDSEADATSTLGSFARSLRRLLVTQPHAAAIIHPAAVLQTRGAATCAALLGASGFDDDASRWIVEALVGFVSGHTSISLESTAIDDDAAFETGLRFMLAGLREELGE